MNETGVIPLIRYRDVTQAVHWLTSCFGFKIYNKVENSDGSIAYAELTYGRGILMIGPVGHSEFDEILKLPHEINGINTQCCYVVLKDIVSHYRQTCQAGAEIVLELSEHNRCEHTYVARDIEGHLWNFGTYSPWKRLGYPTYTKQKIFTNQPPNKKYTRPIAISAVIALILCSSLTLVRSYLTITEPAQVYPTPKSNSETLGKFSNTETVTQNRKKDLLSSLEGNQYSSPNGVEIIEKISNPLEISSKNKLYEEGSWSSSAPIEKKEEKNITLISSSKEQPKIQDNKQRENLLSHKNPSSVEKSQYPEPYTTGNEVPRAPEFLNTTGSIGDQSIEDPTVSPEEPLPPVTVPRTVPSEIKATKVKKSVEIKKNKSKSLTPKMTPAANKKKNLPSTEKTLFYLFN